MTAADRSPGRAPRTRTEAETDSRFRPSFPLIDAKLHPPAPRSGLVPRGRLIRLLTAATRPSIVTVIAPPGYGKTVLLTEWAAQESRPVAWLTLDDLDNTPSLFLTYLAAAIDGIHPLGASVGTAIAAPAARLLGTAVPQLASELHRIGRPALIVLDDVHRLVDRTCLDALAALLEYTPDTLQVAVAGRMEPDLPLARFRARRGLLEITRDELALDPDETTALAAAAGIPLSPEDSLALTERAEGWAAGIYLASLAHQRSGGGTHAITDISGRDGHIAEYLRAEIQPSLREEDTTFLTRTSILEFVSPPLAEAVAGTGGAAERLRSLAQADQLIAPVAGSEGAYRYHHLLREYLRAGLDRREPGAAPELHRRAATWFRSAGRLDLAVEHMRLSGDTDATADLVTAVALPTFYGGHGDTLDRWLQGFDDPDFERHPGLAVIAGWIHLMAGRPEATDRMADIADRVTFAGPPGDGAASFESQRAMLRAMMARHGPGDVLANATLAAMSEGPRSPWRGNALWLLGVARLMHGDTDAADVALAQAAETAKSAGATAGVATVYRARLAIARGDWRAAEVFARESRATLARARLGEMLPSLLFHAVAARVFIHRGDRVHAGEELVRTQVLRPLASYAAPWYAIDALVELARAYLAVADIAGAQSVVREADDIARRRPDLGVSTVDLAEMRRRLADVSLMPAGPSTLTPAELRLLPILATHLTFPQIADRLNVSYNTVKSHAASIYGKLGVSSRYEAVERAVDIGLLEPFPGLPPERRAQAD